ncbi:DNA-directed RNA polymerase I [Rozella allomycis CSF55]|uniref:DNA-directed RNA polymerases I, II, and III subunit RPABC1 n=1 Tax=Rozella allomycis (strain CSF55) TaxID=988480 RepID=A0A075AWG8_ROZAC|nr:RNA polymerase, subunit H/Rpb5 domain-containing protein [Rozella allomycis CSF55]RKP21562.1 DNA-directed RNA polymerase I [Rozella allomycis CSF55]|eukprot:EPZ34645.1 RNA polymerase, subunit H/Rpb5 domain-containing protein [Rozella allomycis CSF55]
MNERNTESVRLWRVHKTVHQMVHDRGYVVSQSELDLSLQDFLTKFGQNGMITETDPTNQLYVFFAEELSLGVKSIRDFVDKMSESNVFRGIIIHRQKMTPPANKVIEQLSHKFTLEKFEESELVVNITEHILVPKHQLMSDEEKKELLEKYHLKESQLPRILISDPVARYYGLKRGQVVKITRASETAGRYVTYRMAY